MEEIVIGTIAGLAFQCQSGDSGLAFQLTAPNAESFAEHMGDWTSLYGWNEVGPLRQIEPPESYEMIVDRLPNVLMLSWRVTNNSPVAIGIFDYEQESRRARFAMSYETNPASRASTMTETRGECRVVSMREGDE
ncbi:MAG: hypothetical protein AAGE05_00030 [Pseudomonadota bacterium]